MPSIRVTASIGLPGREYYRNGTTVGVMLLLGRKLSNSGYEPKTTPAEVMSIAASTVEDAFDQALAAGLRFGPKAE